MGTSKREEALQKLVESIRQIALEVASKKANTPGMEEAVAFSASIVVLIDEVMKDIYKDDIPTSRIIRPN